MEHPVTESLTGVNLPATQLQVAMGIPLHRMPEIRRFYGRAGKGGAHECAADEDPIDFMQESYIQPTRHVMAARITAENADEGFKPTSGRIERVRFQSTDNVWGYFSVGTNGGIHEFADSQFGHIFASGVDREDARRALVLALKGIDVRGDIRTTVEYLIKLLEMPSFVDNSIDTSWLDTIIAEKSVAVQVPAQTVALCAAAFKAHGAVEAQTAAFCDSLSKGQTSLMTVSSLLAFPVEVTYDDVKYQFSVQTQGPGIFSLGINGHKLEVRVREQPDKSLLCSVGGESLQLFGREEALGLRMSINGVTVMLPTVFNPAELRSDVTGRVVRFLQQDRDMVEKGQPYVEVEAMKMIMALKASESGEIRHNLSPGSIIAVGDLIASLTLKDPSTVKRVSTFREHLSMAPNPTPLAIEDAQEKIALAMDGYQHEDISIAVAAFFANASLSQAEGLIAEQLRKFLAAHEPFSGREAAVVVGELVKAQSANDGPALSTTPTEALSLALRSTVVPKLIAYKQTKPRAALALALLRELEFLPKRFPEFGLTTEQLSVALQEVLQDLATMQVRELQQDLGPLKLKAQQLVDSAILPPFQQRLDALKTQLLTSDPGAEADLKALSKQPNLSVSVDLLGSLMSDANPEVCRAAIEVYVRRVYRAHCISSFAVKGGVEETGESARLAARWTFSLRDVTADGSSPLRYGYMELAPDVASLEGKGMGSLIQRAAKYLPAADTADAIGATGVTVGAQPLNVLHVACSRYDQLVQSDAEASQVARRLQALLTPLGGELRAAGIRMVNFLLVGATGRPGQPASYFNFYAETGFAEDPLSRSMRPTLPALLELSRIAANYNLVSLPSVGRNAFLFLGTEKEAAGKTAAAAVGARSAGPSQQLLFLRSISMSSASATPRGAERMVLMALEELERAALDPRVSADASARLFVNLVADVPLTLGNAEPQFRSIMDQIVSKHATRLLRLRVDDIEVKIHVADDGAEGGVGSKLLVPLRLVASSSRGGWLTREVYREYLNPFTEQSEQFCTLGSDSMCVLDPYPRSSKLQRKRAAARRVGSTYAADFLALVEVALINSWQTYLEAAGLADSSLPPANLFAFEELVLGADGELQHMKRFPGDNSVGMLAWHTTLKTPQYPEGREVVFIANDVTVQSGSFGVQEDAFFFKASEYARLRGVPRVFISCNSGARIGLAEELKPKFRVAWKEDGNPGLGFDYLYLSEEDFRALPRGTVEATEVVAQSGEVR